MIAAVLIELTCYLFRLTNFHLMSIILYVLQLTSKLDLHLLMVILTIGCEYNLCKPLMAKILTINDMIIKLGLR